MIVNVLVTVARVFGGWLLVAMVVAPIVGKAMRHRPTPRPAPPTNLLAGWSDGEVNAEFAIVVSDLRRRRQDQP